MRDLMQVFDPRLNPQMAIFVQQVLLRLLLAAFLGGMIGLEREFKHKAAGLRTNMFICFGSAMFTVLSSRLATEFGGDHTRIAAQIIPGIGFLGAGSILHSKAGTTGLTTAATIFVVASIGMAAGGGLYLPAMFATILLLLALIALGWIETTWNLKPLALTYEVIGDTSEDIMEAVSTAMDEERKTMGSIQVGRSNSHVRVQFTVEALRSEHERLRTRLRTAPQIQRVETVQMQEIE